MVDLKNCPSFPVQVILPLSLHHKPVTEALSQIHRFIHSSVSTRYCQRTRRVWQASLAAPRGQVAPTSQLSNKYPPQESRTWTTRAQTAVWTLFVAPIWNRWDLKGKFHPKILSHCYTSSVCAGRCNPSCHDVIKLHLYNDFLHFPECL